MKVVKFEILKLALPMVHSFESSLGRLSHKETIITKLYADNGLVGYGESSSFFAPYYNHETVDTCYYIQENFIAPQVVGKEFASTEEFRSTYGNIVGNKIAKTGPECAFWHLLAQEQGVSLKKLVGGVRAEVPVGESIGIKPTIQDTLDEIDQCLKKGYIRIKVKIKPGWDIKLIEAIRAKHSTMDLTVDGNSAYSLAEHANILAQLDQFDLTMLEQPLGADDIIDHARLAKKIKTPICLDESIESVEDARKAIEIGACSIINIKPGRVGGLVESIKIHDLCEEKGISVWCGGLLETGIGRAFNIAMASKSGFHLAADMSPFNSFYVEDLIDPSYTVKLNGHIDVPTDSGLGYNIRDGKIKEFTIQHKVIGA